MAAAAAAPAPAKADRAAYYATKGAGGARADKDLVGGVEAGTMALEAVAPAALPEDLRAMDKPALKIEIERLGKLRKAAQRELSKVAKQRDEYLQTQARGAGFDAKVNAAIDAQLK
jgi:hypothetical protein